MHWWRTVNNLPRGHWVPGSYKKGHTSTIQIAGVIGRARKYRVDVNVSICSAGVIVLVFLQRSPRCRCNLQCVTVIKLQEHAPLASLPRHGRLRK